MDIRHLQKFEYIPGNVRKSNLECGNYFVLHELLTHSCTTPLLLDPDSSHMLDVARWLKIESS